MSSSVPVRLIGGTLANELLPLKSRYFAAFHMLSLSSRNSSQCCFLCLLIVLWKSLFALVAVLRASASSLPCRLSAHARFPQYVYDFLSMARSSFHQLFMYSDGFALRQCFSSAWFNHAVSLLVIVSTSSVGEACFLSLLDSFSDLVPRRIFKDQPLLAFLSVHIDTEDYLYCPVV